MKFGTNRKVQAVNGNGMTTPRITLGEEANLWRAGCAERYKSGSEERVGRRTARQRALLLSYQRALELSMEYALAALRRPEQILYTLLVDRRFGAIDYLGPSELYPWMRRVTRLKATMILYWDSVSAPLKEWPL